MNIFQIINIALLIIFYGAYLLKLLNQKKKGIQTTQLGKGSGQSTLKSERTLHVEKFVSTMSYCVIVILAGSVFINWHMIDNSGIRIAGLILTGLGCLTFISGMITMKDSWRAGIPEEDKTNLVYRGIYRLSRNPAFLGFDLIYIGTTLTFTNVASAIVTILAMLSLHLLILEEEKFLEQRFGEEYSNYKKKVRRYL